MTVSVISGDNRDSLRVLITMGIQVDSVVCDPPYGLVSIQKRFGKQGSAPARTEKNDGSFARLSGGFMGKAWDSSGIENDPEFWRLVWEVLKPGGYIVAFSSSRTFHRMACAIEDAGFITHPMIGWLNGQGFPKAHAADKAIDKALGAEGSIMPIGEPVKRMIPGADQHRDGSWIKDNGREYQPGAYVPATEEAAQWVGWAYGGQVRKPALEPIYVGQKPFSEKTGAANILKHGVGAVNIDGCRVPAEAGRSWRQPSHVVGGNSLSGSADGSLGNEIADKSHLGRYPANLIHDGSPEVLALFPGEEGRFFECYPFEDQPAFYHPKAGKEDRGGSKHPTVKPIALMASLVRHVTPPGGIVLDPFAGTGTTGVAAQREGVDCILMEAEPEYVTFLKERFK